MLSELTDALVAKVNVAQGQLVVLRAGGYGHTYEAKELEARIATLKEVISMTRHPTFRGTT